MTDEQKRHARELRYKRLFDISIEEYDAMLAFQGGGCAICGKPHEKYNFPVDHEHKSGIVRGVLCSVCNQLLKEKVNREWLEKALQYIIAPPSFLALGRLPQGRVGRVTKRHKRRKHVQEAV